MARTTISRPTLGIHLMHRGMGALRDGNHRCADCRRTPLIGETVYVYAGEKRVCELCKHFHREEPVSSEPVLGHEHGATVRVRARAA